MPIYIFLSFYSALGTSLRHIAETRWNRKLFQIFGVLAASETVKEHGFFGVLIDSCNSNWTANDCGVFF